MVSLVLFSLIFNPTFLVVFYIASSYLFTKVE